MAEKRKEEKQNIGIIVFWTIFTLTLTALVAGYVAAAMYFRNHLFYGSTINGVETSCMTPSQAMAAMNIIRDDYVLEIKTSGGRSEFLSAEDLGIDMNVTAADIQEVLDRQNEFLWPLAIVDRPSYYEEGLIAYNEKTVRKAVDGLECVKKHTTETKDAYIDFVNDRYEVVSEVYGDEVNKSIVYTSVIAAVKGMDTELDLAEIGCYRLPKLYSDDSKLTGCVEKLNKYVTSTFTYSMVDNEYVIDPSLKAEWFTYDENYDVVFDEGAVKDFVSDMAGEFNTVGKSKPLQDSSTGDTVNVPAGNYGWKIDEDQEYEQLLKDLQSGKDVSRDFMYSQTAASHGEKDYGNSYVEVNLTEQHVWLYKDGELVIDTDCVTGNLSAGNGTHVGAYGVTYKKSPAILRGEDYETPVTYWMPFHNGEGLHDATWRGRFGGSIYKTSGSHGCVNLPKKAAATIYETVEAGFPVLVYATTPMPNAQVPATKVTLSPTEAAQHVIDMINGIGWDETAITQINAAKVSYGELTDEAKALVYNYDALLAHESWYAETYLTN